MKLTAHTEVMDDWVYACSSVVFLHEVTATTSPLPTIIIGCLFLCTEISEVKCKVLCVLVMKECMGNRGLAPLILWLFAGQQYAPAALPGWTPEPVLGVLRKRKISGPCRDSNNRPPSP